MAHIRMDEDKSGEDGYDLDGWEPASTMIAALLAVVFVVIGVLGFFITGFGGFWDHHTDKQLLWFEINPAHNAVHLLSGVIGLALSQTVRSARTFSLIIGLGYAGILGYGL